MLQRKAHYIIGRSKHLLTNKVFVKSIIVKNIDHFLILIFALCCCSCGQSNKPNLEEIKTAEWKMLTDDQFVIKHPIEWDVDTSGQMGSSFFFFSKRTDDNDRFKENVNLIIQNLRGNELSLDKYIEISEDQINAIVTNAKILSSDRIGVGEDTCHKIVYLGTQGQFNLRFDQYLWLIDEVAYILTLTCEEDEFKKYEAIGYEILNSFEIKSL